MVTKEQVIAGLRCIVKDSGKCEVENCPYERIEILEDERLIQQLGTAEWKSCDADAALLDAADLLEGKEL